MHFKMRSFNILFIMVLTYPLLSQKAYFVSPNGNNNNDGSIGKPWQSINYALGKIFPGDTLYLREGTYYELVNNFIKDGEPNQWITIRNYPGERPILNGNGNWTVIEFKNRKYYYFHGLEITNAVWSGFNGTNYHFCKISHCIVHSIGPSSGTAVGIYVSGTPGKPDSSTHNIIENNIIYDCYGEGIYIGNDAHSLPPDGSSCNSNIIRRNEIYRCVDGIDIKTGSRWNRVVGNRIHDCNDGEYSAGIIVYEYTEIDSNIIDHNINYGIFVQGNHNRITRNYIYKNKSYGILVTGYESLWNNYKDSGDENVILNNTIVGNGSWGIYLYGDANQDSRGTVLKNNIVAFNGQYQWYATEYGTIGLVLDSNDWFTLSGKLMYFRNKEIVDINELDLIYGTNSKSWNKDPEFENMDQDDYRLKSSSPLIDKGALVDFPYFGQAPDIGAFESIPPTSPPLPDTSSSPLPPQNPLPENQETPPDTSSNSSSNFPDTSASNSTSPLRDSTLFATLNLEKFSSIRKKSYKILLTTSRPVVRVPSPLIFIEADQTQTEIRLEGNAPGQTFRGELVIDASIADGQGVFYLSNEALIDADGKIGSGIKGKITLVIDKTPPRPPLTLRIR